jgi:ATP-dependent DNA helicase DinG
VALSDLVEKLFAQDGPLARRLPGYAPRTAQIDMAMRCAEVLGKRRGRLVIEAGTGVGKSLAYLAPVLLSQRKAVVTTATKALQDQLFAKDVPLAWACVKELLGEDSAKGEANTEKPEATETKDDAVLVKGRQNYLCKLRFEEFARQPLFVFPGDTAPTRAVRDLERARRRQRALHRHRVPAP